MTVSKDDRLLIRDYADARRQATMQAKRLARSVALTLEDDLRAQMLEGVGKREALLTCLKTMLEPLQKESTQ